MSEKYEEITLKEVIFKTREWWAYILSKWVILLMLGILGGLSGILYATIKKPIYIGTLTFVLSNDSKNGVGGLASLAGQFGVDIGGASNGAFEGENIIELLKSKKIVKGALLKDMPDGKDILINVIGDEFGLFKNWKKNGRLVNEIPIPRNANKLTPVQDSLISVIYDILIKKNLNISKLDKKLSFYQVTATTSKQDISIWLTKYLVVEAAKLYIDTKTKTFRENLNMLQHEVDSIQNRLSGTIYSSISTVDATFNLNPALQTKRAPVQQNQLQLQALGIAYGEVLKNLEIAKITLQKETPLYQIIDEPSFPLTRIRTGKIKAGLIGGILVTVFGVIFLSFRRFIKGLIKFDTTA